MNYYIVAFLIVCHLSLSGVNFINITKKPIYFRVYYKTAKSIKPQIKEIYIAQPNGSYFMNLDTFTIKDPNIQMNFFHWPKQKCVEFTQEELIALGVGVGVGAAALGAAGGALLGAAAAGPALEADALMLTGTFMIGVPSAAAESTTAAGSTIALGAALGTPLGGVGGVFAGDGLCKAEHYPRTVLFSFNKEDVERFSYDRSSFAQLKTTTGLYLGDNVDGGETHFLFYNYYGFDPRYGAYGDVEGHGAIKGMKINSVRYESNKPLIANALRRYLHFCDYYKAD